MLLSGVAYKVKSRGPKTDPWGTANVTSAMNDKQSPSLILWLLPVRYQSIKHLWCQYPRWSQAQRQDSQINVQQQIEETVPYHQQAITHAGFNRGKVKEMCLQMFLKGSNWNGLTDRQRELVPKRRGTRVKTSCTCVGLDPRDWQTIIVVWSQWTGWM